MHSTATRLKGVLPAIASPFNQEGKLDEKLFSVQVEYLVEAGVDGFFIAGTTAEGPYLTTDERVRMVEIVRATTVDRMLCCVAVLAASTESVIAGIDSIAHLNPDFVSAVTPLYMSLSQRDIIHHFTAIADHSIAPLILYNIPQNTHSSMTLETILKLSDHPNIAGIKDSSGNFMNFQLGLLTTDSSGFTWIQGDDLLDAAAFLMGARCVVTGLGNAWIEPYVRMYRAAVYGDLAEVILQQRYINNLAQIISQTGGSVIPSIKCAATLQGRFSSRMRIGSMELDDSQKSRVKSVLSQLGLTTVSN